MRVGSHAIMAAFGSIGRRSNRLNYTVYTKSGSNYIESTAQGNGDEIVYGDAVEFCYWEATEPDESLLDTSVTGTNYAFFYIDNGQMKVDYGQYPPGAVPGGIGAKNENDISTTVLADNVVPAANGAFNHTVINNVGQGCVRIDVTLEDEDNEGENIRVMTATLLRNIWPR
jgi:hypothetical protein